MKKWATSRDNHMAGDLLARSSLRIVFEDKGTDVAYIPSTADTDNGNYVAKVITAAPALLSFVTSRAKSGDSDAKRLIYALGFAEYQ